MDNGDKWDISVDLTTSTTAEVTARKYDNCDTVVETVTLPADRCEPFSVNISDTDYDITFDLEWI